MVALPPTAAAARPAFLTNERRFERRSISPVLPVELCWRGNFSQLPALRKFDHRRGCILVAIEGGRAASHTAREDRSRSSATARPVPCAALVPCNGQIRSDRA